MAGAATLAVAALVWWFWPREEPEVRVVWQGQPQFTQRDR